MNEQRFVCAIFCDDIRQEVGNKFSLIGCYGQGLVTKNFPVALPKLCAHVRVYTSSNNPFQKLVIRAKLGQEYIAELDIPVDNMDTNILLQDEPSRTVLNAHMVFSPLIIVEPTVLRIEVETESGTIQGSTLGIVDSEKELDVRGNYGGNS